jgi:hypothetical protein
MCDLNRVSGFLIAAKAAYIAVLVLLGIAILNSASFFAAAANVALMVTAIALAAVATSMYIAALVELDRCATSPCGAELEPVRRNLIALLATMAVFTAGLVTLALVAAIPFAGAAAVGAFISVFIAFTVLVSGGIEVMFAQAVQAYNTCRARAGLGGILGAVIALAYIVTVFAVLFSVGLGLLGKIPWNVVFRFGN